MVGVGVEVGVVVVVEGVEVVVAVVVGVVEVGFVVGVGVVVVVGVGVVVGVVVEVEVGVGVVTPDANRRTWLIAHREYGPGDGSDCAGCTALLRQHDRTYRCHANGDRRWQASWPSCAARRVPGNYDQMQMRRREP